MKTVYLLGDSIRYGASNSPGYGIWVKKLLDGFAEVEYPDDNCRFAQYTLRYAHEWAQKLDGKPVDIVHWNNGLWDCLQLFGDEPFTPVPFYVSTLERIYRRLVLLFPKAEITFALSTPVIESMGRPEFMRYNRVIEEYNAAAAELMARLGVPVDDLYSAAAAMDPSLHADWVHYTDEGSRLLAEAVIRFLRGNTSLGV